MLKTLQEHKMSFTELLGFASKLYKLKFKTLAFVTLVFAIPLSLISSFILGESMSIIDILNTSMLGGMPNIQALGQLWIYILILLLISMLIAPIGSVAVSIAIKKTLHEEEISWGKALLQGFEKGPSIIFAGLIYSICVGFCSILIIPGIYLATIWYFYYIIIAIDDQPAIESLTQSKNVVKGQWWATFGIILIIGVCTQIISYIFTAILSVAGDTYVLNVVYYIFLYFIQTYVTVLLTIMYMNRKFMIIKGNEPENNYTGL